MKFKVFTAQEASVVIMDKLKQRGLGMFVSLETVQDIVSSMYNEGEWLGGYECSPYVQRAQEQSVRRAQGE